MSLDKEKDCGCNSSENERGCGCNDNEKSHGHSDGCGCNGHDNDEGCGCGEHEHQSVTLTLEDDTELECPIIDAFEINEQGYIALLHPIDETVLLYRFADNEDETIDIETIEEDDEFNLVSKTYLSLQED